MSTEQRSVYLAAVACLVMIVAPVAGNHPVAMADVIPSDKAATTTDYVYDPDTSIPMEATTTFVVPDFNQSPSIGALVARHELLHGLGFTTTAKNVLYSSHIMIQNADDIANGYFRFNEKSDKTGGVIAYLDGNSQAHVKSGVTINGFDQSTSVMVTGLTGKEFLGNFEANILKDTYSYKNLKITPDYIGPGWTLGMKGYVEGAINSAQSLFTDAASTSQDKFTWHVKIVPEPDPGLIFAGIFVVAVLGRFGRSKRRRIATGLLLMGAIHASCSALCLAGPELAVEDDLRFMPTSNIVAVLDSPDPQWRVKATAELFRRGKSILPDLKRAGAKPMGGIPSRRLDVVFALIDGLPPGQYQPDSIGIYGAKLDRASVLRLGNRYGFDLPEHVTFARRSYPSCYVQLRPGKTLVEVMRSLMTEPSIIDVSLNYFDH